MKLTPLSLFLTVFSGGVILYLLYMVRQRLLSLRMALIWVILWSGIGLFSLYPAWLDLVIAWLEMENRMIFVLLVAAFVLLLWVFNLNLQLYRIQSNWQTVVREKAVFLIGSPRSGTTILENILNCHEKITEFYEPYFLWEHFFRVDDNDVWDRRDLTPRAATVIQREFATFARRCDKHLVLDKLPTHSFNIPLIQQIFPEARWIHILRDGRDVTLSIHKEWEKRKQMVENKDFVSLYHTAKAMLDRQPFWRYKFMAVTHELTKSFSLNPYRYLNKSRWKGQAGWGPRFEGWQDYLQSHTALEFNAMQWVKTVEAVQAHWAQIPEKNKIEVRYEDLLSDPVAVISSIIDFLGYRPQEGFFEKIPELITDNVEKWKDEFTEVQIETIKPILTPLLEKTGYLQKNPW
ncbi:MAG: DUF2304 family protein [Desulfosudaceae bacterium]